MLKTLYQNGSQKILFDVKGKCIKFELHNAIGDTPYTTKDWSLYKATTVFVDDQNKKYSYDHVSSLFGIKTYAIENLIAVVASGEYVDDND
nr:MAG TPA: hypothetical protein [Caudoviricetes sp.]